MSSIFTSLSDGTAKITGGNITDATSITVNTITEKTLDNGVDIETVHLEDGVISNVSSIIATNITDATMTGFKAWGGGGPYYSIAGIAPAVFTLLQSGTGYIKSAPVSWTATQTVNLVANSTNFIVIDSAGLIQALTTTTSSVYETYIGLFEVFFDGTANYLTKKENHPYKFQTTVSSFIHNNIGPIVRGSGSNLAIGTTTTKVQIVGDDVIEDHGLQTNITAADPITIRYFRLNSAGKWLYYSTSDIVPAFYNQTPTYTATALTGNKRTVFRVYVVLDDLNSTSPIYIAVMNSAAAPFANLAAANTAINAGTITGATNELYSVEPVQLGYVIVNNNGGSPIVEEVIIQKNTAKAQYSSGSAGGDHLLLANINGGQYSMGGHTGVAQRFISASAAPTANDDIDSYLKACVWIKEDTDDIYINVDNTDTQAVWRKMAYDGASIAALTCTTLTTTTITEIGTTGVTIEGITLKDNAIATNLTVLKIGSSAATTGTNPVAIGTAATVLGNDGICIGNTSFASTSSITIGAGSGKTGSTGTHNVAMGNTALTAITTGTNLVAIGQNAGNTITAGDYCICIGTDSDCAADIQAGTAIGKTAIVEGADGICIGNASFAGPSSIIMGAGTGKTGASGTNTIGIGNAALTGLTTGTYNVGIGYQAGATLTTGNYNMCLGYTADGAADVDYQIAIGYATKSLAVNSVAIGRATQSYDNEVMIGYYCAPLAHTGTHNVGIGYRTFQAITSGHGNVGIGGYYDAAIKSALQNLTSGMRNVGIGNASGATITTGGYNVCIGDQADIATNNINNCVAIGNQAVCATAQYGIAIGCTARAYGGSSIMIGAFCGTVNNGAGNIGLGNYTMAALNAGTYNIGIGETAGNTITAGDYCICIGYNSDCAADIQNGIAIGNTAIAGTDCIVIGNLAGSATQAASNILIGYKSGNAMIAGADYNVVVGWQAGMTISSGNRNVLMGGRAGEAITIGTYNTCMGQWAGRYITEGTYNVCVGYNAGNLSTTGYLTTGDHNIYMGNEAHGSATLDYQIAIGYQAVTANTKSIAIGWTATCSLWVSIAIGSNAKSITQASIAIGESSSATGVYATAIGGSATTTGDNAIAIGLNANAVQNCISIGNSAAQNSTTGYNSVCIGTDAARYVTTRGGLDASFNVAIGYQALRGNVTTGPRAYLSVAIGYQALLSATYVNNAADAINNVAIGAAALQSLTIGNSNTAIGFQAGNTITTGTHNVCVGIDSDCVATCVNGIAIGNSAYINGDLGIAIGCSSSSANLGIAMGYSAGVTGTYGLSIGNQSSAANTTKIGFQGTTGMPTTACYIYGVDGAGVTGGVAVLVGDDGRLGTSTSSIRYKTNVRDTLQSETSFLYDIRIVQFDRINGTSFNETGIIAEELYAIKPDLVVMRGDQIETYNKDSLVPYMIKEIQIQNAKITTLTEQAIYDGATINALTCTGLAASTINEIGTAGVSIEGITFKDAAIATNLNNIAIGYQANVGTGDSITIGAQSGTNITADATRNTIIGGQSGQSITTGSNNTLLGYNAEVDATSTNAMALGYNATAAGDNVIVLGDSAVQSLRCNTQSIIALSDQRYKDNIEQSKLGLSFIMQLKPRQYKYKDWTEYGQHTYDKTGLKIKPYKEPAHHSYKRTHYGFVAQEVMELVKTADPNAAFVQNPLANNKKLDPNDRVHSYIGLDYREFHAPIVKAIQEFYGEFQEAKKSVETAIETTIDKKINENMGKVIEKTIDKNINNAVIKALETPKYQKKTTDIEDIYTKLHQTKNELEDLRRTVEGYKTLLDIEKAYTQTLEERIQALEKLVRTGKK